MVQLCAYQEKDAEYILSWSRDEFSFYQWSAGVLGDYPLTLEQFSKVKENIALSAFRENELVGFIMMRYPNKNRENIRFGFVIMDSSKRGQGLGKELLQSALSYAKEKLHAKKVSLGVFENNPIALHCYQNVGFKSLDIKETYSIHGQDWTCIEMEYCFEE